ncbi:MAG: HAD family hydrolase [Actinomycetota bacterium]|nr:HAD family hydrolase [Actinomycetota bacterium]
MSRRRAVFLDRDGVLNEAGLRDGGPIPPPSADHLRLLPGVAEACQYLAAAGLVLVVVTNQPDISRGALEPQELERMHRHLRGLVSLDAIYVCPHDDADGCPCRKPRPGLILQAARELDLDLNHSVLVGDRWRDIDAAQRAGVPSVHIKCNHGEPLRTPADATFASLYDARETIIGLSESGTTKRSAP